MRIDRFIGTMRHTWDRIADGLLAAGCLVLSLVLYLQTLAPSIARLFDDSLEFPLVAYRLGIAHPTGYPLYTLLAKMFSLGPGYNVAWAVNLLSAVGGALAVALVYLTARQLTSRRWPALLGAGALAVSPVFWSQAVVAEVYTLNAALVAGLLALALRWARQPLAPVKPFSLLLVGPRDHELRERGGLFLPREPRPKRARPEAVAADEAQPDEVRRKQVLTETRAEETGAEASQPEEVGADEHEPHRREQLFMPGEGLWMRLPPVVRRTAHRTRVVYQRVYSAVRQAVHRTTQRLDPVVRRVAHGIHAAYQRSAPVVRRAAHRVYAVYRRFYPAVPPARRLQIHPLAYGLAFLVGLGLAHHRTILLVVPALLVFAFLMEHRVFSRAALLGPEHRDRPRWRQIAGRPGVLLAACVLGPLLLYLYLPIRGSVGSLDGTYANTWRGFWQWVTAGGYNTFLGDNPLARSLDAAFYGQLFWDQFGPVGLALALVGLIALLRRPKVLALTGLAFAAYVTFAVAYRVPDVEVFFIPAFVLAAVWIAVGIDHAVNLLRLRGPSLAVRRLQAASSLVLVLTATAQPLYLAARNAPDLDLSRSWLAHDYGRYVLDQDLPYGNTTIVGLGGEMNLLRYFQETTGQGADVETVIADDEAARLAAVEAALARGRAVYITRPLPGLARGHTLDAVVGLMEAGDDQGMLLRVDGPDGPVPRQPEGGAVAIPGVRLRGAELEEHRAHWQAWARLRLWWRAPDGLGENLKISARLEEPGGRTIAAVDAEPLGGAYPTTAWRPGEVVADAYEIPLPPGTPPGNYTPVIVVYDPATGAERGRIELAPAYLEGNPARPPQRVLEASLAEMVYARFGDLDLLGFTPPDPTVTYLPGDGLPLTLAWQAPGQPAGKLGLTFLLEGDRADPLETDGDQLVGGKFPAAQWQAGQVVRQWPVARVPGDVPPGAYRLKMRVTRDGQPVPWGRGGLPRGSDLDLGPVQIGP